MKRASGILLHVSSLPSPYGVGDFGPAAFRFVDFLQQARQSYWQLLPMNPTDPIYGNSPYSSNSAFALNVLYIDPEILVKQGWLTSQDLREGPKLGKERVDYIAAAKYKDELLSTAFKNCREHLKDNRDYRQFCHTNAFWLEDYARFLALKQHFKGQQWNEWPAELRQRDPNQLNRFCNQFVEKIEEVNFRQYVAFKQFLGLKEYCRKRQVQIIGDIPIYVNFDSADVWANPKIFKLDDKSQPAFVAGVPPDYFSQTGQRWGNPVYDWDELKKQDYDWWLKRIQHNLQLFDIIRIDHFRGLIGYWQIPSQEATAVNGEWKPGPGDDFFYSMKEFFGDELPIIAEDLGIITPDVTEAMQKHGFPGMKILLFAFGGELATHPYIPENFTTNCVVYTGTHDNNTAKGWIQNDASEEEKEHLKEYFGKKIKKDALAWTLTELAFQSKADTAIVPIQDFLGLGAEARMNVPGTTHGNWEWRLSGKSLTPGLAEKIKDLTQETGRDPDAPQKCQEGCSCGEG